MKRYIDARTLDMSSTRFGKYSEQEGNFMAKAVVDANACVGCEACVGTCPVEAIATDGGKAKVNPDTCIECGSCVSTCPVGAISQ
jgi:ferredoxin